MTESEEKEMTELRTTWKKVRADRLARKKLLLEKGTVQSVIRSDKEHKRLRKEQDHLATRLRHLGALRSRECAKSSKAEKL
jgi:hypothetical protein